MRQGLSDEEVLNRRREFGYNELERSAPPPRLFPWGFVDPKICTSPHENLFLKFLTFFQGPNRFPFFYGTFSDMLLLPGPILYCMELAVVLAGGLRDWVDFGVIIGILMLNAFVGWYQEKQAGDIVAQLKAGIALHAIVSI
jgi:H+-transporting ATPase